jgi:hypothetical protein
VRQVVNPPSAVATSTGDADWVSTQILLPVPANGPGDGESTSGGVRASRAAGPFNNIQDAIGSLKTAIGASDVNGAKLACQRLKDAGQRLRSALPNQDRKATSELRGLGQAEINQITAQLDRAMGHFDNAERIVRGG